MFVFHTSRVLIYDEIVIPQPMVQSRIKAGRIFGSFVLFAFLISSLSFAQPAKTIKISALQKLLKEKSHPIHIINFWATWCGPCVKELPFFEKLAAENRPGVKITLVSLDLDLDPNPEKVYKFIAMKNIRSEVLLLEPADPNTWLDKIDKEWSGAIPATILVNHRTGERKFVGNALKEGDLERYLDDLQQ